MKRISIIIITLFSTIISVGQATFEKLITKPKNQVIQSVIEDRNKDLLLCGKTFNLSTNLYKGYIIKLSESGEIVNSKVFSEFEGSSIFFTSFLHNNDYIVIGSKYNDNESSFIWFLRLNESFEVLDNKLLNIPEEKWISNITAIKDSDDRYVLTGYTGNFENGYSVTDPFFYKVSLNGDSITSSFMPYNTPFARVYDIIEKPSNDGYYAFASYLDSTSSIGSILDISKSFLVDGILSIPQNSHNNYSPIFFNSYMLLNSIINAGVYGSNEADLNLMKIDTNAILIDNKVIGKLGDTSDYPSYANGTSRVGLYDLYASGTSHVIENDPFYGSGQKSWIMLGKFSANLEEYWLKYYGGDAYYHTYSMTTTSDHGCVVVASRYDDEHPENDRDIYVLKVNDEGLVTWDESIQPSANVYKVYPNPGNNVLNLDIREKHFVVQLYNNTGQLVLTKENQRSINTFALSSGIYCYRILKHGEILSSGKWVKR